MPHIKARIIRLRQLTEGLCREVTAQKAGDRLLLPQELRQYLDGMLDALAGLDEAGVALARGEEDAGKPALPLTPAALPATIGDVSMAVMCRPGGARA